MNNQPQQNDDDDDAKLQLQRAIAANDWAWKGKTPRVVYDWNGSGNVMVYSGKERIL